MTQRSAVLAAIALALPGVQLFADIQSAAVTFRSGPVVILPQSQVDMQATLQLGGGAVRHVVVKCNSIPNFVQRETLREAGLQLHGYLGAGAYFARIAPNADVVALANHASLAAVSVIDVQWKMHPHLQAKRIPHWAIVETTPTGQPYSVAAYVLFHDDVDAATRGVKRAQAHGAFVRDVLETVNALVIELPLSAVPRLAAEDAVQWIEPPLPQWSELNDSNRELVGANIVQDVPYALDGAGVAVLVYDGGVVSSGHADFAGRLTLGTSDTSGTSGHATHVAGTVGGDGSDSAGQYRGMAPGAEIISYGFEEDGSETFLYTNPGDFEADYTEALTLGAVVSNNSLGSNICSNGFFDAETFVCDYTGDYGITSQLIDSVVNGAAGGAIRVIWSAGNERSCDRCTNSGGADSDGYHSTAPPSCAKNPLHVGGVNSNDDSMTDFSSWGPCDDGRLKPEVMGPGCQSDGDGTVTSCAIGSGYTGNCGTSMASPTVAGLAALMIEDFRIQFPDMDDPSNAMVKALLVHGSEDWGTEGPDFQSGYGSVRIVPTIEAQRTGNFLETEVAQDGVQSFLVVVGPDDSHLKVTLAWDDVAAEPNVQEALINDLDMVVIAPDGVEHFPWTLDPDDPSAPAVQNQPDHRNNIEQVVIASPAAGTYRVEVRGFAVAMGPQSASLVAEPLLVQCSPQGIVGFDRSSYRCGNTMTVRVVDCDLNLDDDASEMINVSVESDSDPEGLTLTLFETEAATAAFEGQILLSAAEQPDSLLISPGDGVRATYVDADDGLGGMDVPVEAVAELLTLGGSVDSTLLEPVDLQNPGIFTDDLVVLQSGTVPVVKLTLNIAHPNPSQLIIRLIHDDVTVQVFDRCDNVGADMTATRFDDGALTPVCEGMPPYTGAFQPEESLSAFEGLPLAGEWTLWVRDSHGSDLGQLVSWSLEFPEDCNNNGVMDACDISSGTSSDIDDDGLPDECATLCTSAASCCDDDGDGIRDDSCTWCACEGGSCANVQLASFGDVGGPFADCTPDGFVGAYDRNHIMHCFMESGPCAQINSDIGGSFTDCAPDGTCDLHDANHALEAFAGTSGCGCGPQPQGPVPGRGSTALVVRGPRRAVAGDRVAVQVWGRPESGSWQSYQLATTVSGAKQGRLILEDIRIESLDTHLFAPNGPSFEALHVAGARMLAGRPAAAAVEPANPAYLATFVYRASRDAVGRFVVDLDAAGTFIVGPGQSAVELTDTIPAVIDLQRRR
jgi:subtilisin family serine protease